MDCRPSADLPYLRVRTDAGLDGRARSADTRRTMSSENVELVLRAIEAFNRGDYDGYTADFAPEFEYRASDFTPGGGAVYRGPDEFRRFTDWRWEGCENVRAEVNEVIEASNEVVISLMMRAHVVPARAETMSSICQVWTLQQGKITRGQGFHKGGRARGSGTVRAGVKPSPLEASWQRLGPHTG